MRNCFLSVKLLHWLVALGVSACLGFVIFTHVVSQNGNLVSSVSGFWMSIGQSSNVSLEIQVNDYRASTFKNDEEVGNLSSGNDDVEFSFASPTDGFLEKELHMETVAMNRNGTLGDVDSSVFEKDRFGDGNQIESDGVVNGTKTLNTDDRVADEILGGKNYSNVKSPLSFSPVEAVSSETNSDKRNQKVSETNIGVSPYGGLNARYKLKTDTEPVSLSDMALSLRTTRSSSRSMVSYIHFSVEFAIL